MDKTFKRLDHDPHPECHHEWTAMGSTTIGDPPIAHSACFLCRSFRHVMLVYMPTDEEETWFSKEWLYPDLWDWERERIRWTKTA